MTVPPRLPDGFPRGGAHRPLSLGDKCHSGGAHEDSDSAARGVATPTKRRAFPSRWARALGVTGPRFHSTCARGLGRLPDWLPHASADQSRAGPRLAAPLVPAADAPRSTTQGAAHRRREVDPWEQQAPSYGYGGGISERSGLTLDRDRVGVEVRREGSPRTARCPRPGRSTLRTRCRTASELSETRGCKARKRTRTMNGTTSTRK